MPSESSRPGPPGRSSVPTSKELAAAQAAAERRLAAALTCDLTDQIAAVLALYRASGAEVDHLEFQRWLADLRWRAETRLAAVLNQASAEATYGWRRTR